MKDIPLVLLAMFFAFLGGACFGCWYAERGVKKTVEAPTPAPVPAPVVKKVEVVDPTAVFSCGVECRDISRRENDTGTRVEVELGNDYRDYPNIYLVIKNNQDTKLIVKKKYSISLTPIE